MPEPTNPPERAEDPGALETIALLRRVYDLVRTHRLIPGDDGWDVVERLCDWFTDQRLTRLQQDLAAARADAVALREIVECVEWCNAVYTEPTDPPDPDSAGCYVCDANRGDGHYPQCWLGSMLAALHQPEEPARG